MEPMGRVCSDPNDPLANRERGGGGGWVGGGWGVGVEGAASDLYRDDSSSEDGDDDHDDAAAAGSLLLSALRSRVNLRTPSRALPQPTSPYTSPSPPASSALPMAA